MSWTEPSLWAWIFFIGEWVIRLSMLVVVPFRRTPAAECDSQNYGMGAAQSAAQCHAGLRPGSDHGEGKRGA